MAASISSMTSLEERILELEIIKARQVAGFKISVAGLIESFSPANMLRTTIKDISQSPGLRSTAINVAIGIGAGFIGKKLIAGSSRNKFKKMARSAVQFLITSFVMNKISERQKKLLHN